MKRLWILLLAVILYVVSAGPALADGVIVVRPIVPRPEPPPNLAVKYHRVTVTIDNQVATTHIDQVFINDSGLELEGDYIFPLPEGANISQFSMWVDGKRLEAQVLTADEARRVYEEIVASRRDPALLEYAGRNAFRARIYPIFPYSEKRIEIEYSEVLPAESGLVRYVYPLNTEKFSSQPLQQVSVSVVISASQGIKAIYSPSHVVAVSREGDRVARVGYEETNITPDRDFVLYYGLGNEGVGLSLLSYKPAMDDGFFLLLVAPPMEAESTELAAKDVTLVLDTSGSMRGEKLAQAKKAADYVLTQLQPGDRFNIVAFATDVQSFRPALCSLSDLKDARTWLDYLIARGGTNIDRALELALDQTQSNRPQVLLFLTDGLPTEGEINSEAILKRVADAAGKDVRLFVFGVGNDVNTFLLDTLAQEHRGVSKYVQPGQNIETEVTALYEKIGQPLLTDVSLVFSGAVVNALYPYPLPDLYVGSQLSVVGRYQGGGTVNITLKGMLNGRAVSYTISQQSLATSGGEELLPRLWATRKVGYLLTQIRLHGADSELVDEVVDLAIRYGIITPYTSFLIDETEDVLTPQGRSAAAQELSPSASADSGGAQPTSSAVGAEAVKKSVDQNRLRDTDVVQADASSAPLQTVGDKTFLFRDGVWVDTQYKSTLPSKEIVFASERYLQLLSQNPEWGRYLALGQNVIVVLDGNAYHFGPQGETEAVAEPQHIDSALAQILRWLKELVSF
ncbi:MAG: VIT domain-containing protein [Anaerolineae bacterium]